MWLLDSFLSGVLIRFVCSWMIVFFFILENFVFLFWFRHLRKGMIVSQIVTFLMLLFFKKILSFLLLPLWPLSSFRGMILLLIHRFSPFLIFWNISAFFLIKFQKIGFLIFFFHLQPWFLSNSPAASQLFSRLFLLLHWLIKTDQSWSCWFNY